MRTLASCALLIAAVIHLLPLAGMLGTARLSALYGIVVEDPNLEILLRHRAVLFGLLGAFLGYAAFQPSLQPLAFIAGTASVVSFLWLARSVAGHNAALERVARVDLVGLACLVFGFVAFVRT